MPVRPLERALAIRQLQVMNCPHVYIVFCKRHRCVFPPLRRPLAYSTLADLVHHVRQNLPLTDLSLAVQLFAKNIDDESLPSNIQTMSCKLLLNLVDCIRSKSEQENGNGRDILMRMLEVCSAELG